MTRLADALSTADIHEIITASSDMEVRTSHDPSVRTFGDLLQKDAGVWEGYTTGSHSERVMRQELRYYTGVPVPQPLTRGSFLLFLLLHDCGKGLGERAAQHTYTSEVMEYLWNHGALPISGGEMSVFRSLLLDNATSPYSQLFAHLYRVRPLGQYKDKEAFRAMIDALPGRRWGYQELTRYVKGLELHDIDMTERVESLAQNVRREAARVGMGSTDYLKLLLRYFQCDTSSYSSDSSDLSGVRGYPAFDYVYELNPDYDATDLLFVFDPARQRLRFATGLDSVVQQLEDRVAAS
jgi:hypothetical protein